MLEASSELLSSLDDSSAELDSGVHTLEEEEEDLLLLVELGGGVHVVVGAT